MITLRIRVPQVRTFTRESEVPGLQEHGVTWTLAPGTFSGRGASERHDSLELKEVSSFLALLYPRTPLVGSI